MFDMQQGSSIRGTTELPGGTTAERLAARGPVAVAARHATLATLAAEAFDIVIIGGGITGAGVAREAALAGLRTALLERDDFASGTSSRSSRLVHGGVRYLEHGHFSLVFEVEPGAPPAAGTRAAPRPPAGVHLAGVQGCARAEVEGARRAHPVRCAVAVSQCRAARGAEPRRRPRPRAGRWIRMDCWAARATGTPRPTTRGSRSPVRSRRGKRAPWSPIMRA
jgi:hypothetical protein